MGRNDNHERKVFITAVITPKLIRNDYHRLFKMDGQQFPLLLKLSNIFISRIQILSLKKNKFPQVLLFFLLSYTNMLQLAA